MKKTSDIDFVISKKRHFYVRKHLLSAKAYLITHFCEKKISKNSLHIKSRINFQHFNWNIKKSDSVCVFITQM